jgi:AAA+ ATPase superfamily predicted ATPase
MSHPLSFIGRQKELAALQNAYESKESAFIPIYGRRRVGKSELILHFAESRPAVYFLGKKAPADEQIREFLEVAARVVEDPLIASMPANDWKKAL